MPHLIVFFNLFMTQDTSGLLQIAVSTPLPTDYPVLAHFRARSAVDTALVIMESDRLDALVVG
jgi:hypothetical protein